MLADKATLYDWNGANVALFKMINAIHGDSYDKVMILISRLADYHNFPYYFLAFSGWALLNFFWRKIRGAGGARQYLIMWSGAILVFGAGFGAEALTIKAMKQEFSYPRPYIALGSQDVHVIMDHKDSDDGRRSFPSGHVAFITLAVFALWSVLPAAGKLAGLILIGAVCWSRMALGMHFPADVMGGLLIGFLVSLFARMIIFRILAAFNLRC